MTHFNFDKFLSDFCTTLIFHKFIYTITLEARDNTYLKSGV